MITKDDFEILACWKGWVGIRTVLRF